MLYLVRHGQASFGAANYDQLSALGLRQSQRLGEYLAGKGLVFEAALRGTLQRQRQTLEGICQGAGMAPPTLEWPGLNEYDSAAILAAIHPQPLPRPDSAEQYRNHFRLLREGLRQWMDGRIQPQGMPDYPRFADGVWQALEHVRAHCSGNVLLVSSGGPIATAVGQVLGAPAHATIELNMHIRNSAVTELRFNPRRHTLLSFNHLPHLEGPTYQDWVTYA